MLDCDWDLLTDFDGRTIEASAATVFEIDEYYAYTQTRIIIVKVIGWKSTKIYLHSNMDRVASTPMQVARIGPCRCWPATEDIDRAAIVVFAAAVRTDSVWCVVAFAAVAVEFAPTPASTSDAGIVDHPHWTVGRQPQDDDSSVLAAQMYQHADWVTHSAFGPSYRHHHQRPFALDSMDLCCTKITRFVWISFVSIVRCCSHPILPCTLSCSPACCMCCICCCCCCCWARWACFCFHARSCSCSQAFFWWILPPIRSWSWIRENKYTDLKTLYGTSRN